MAEVKKTRCGLEGSQRVLYVMILLWLMLETCHLRRP